MTVRRKKLLSLAVVSLLSAGKAVAAVVFSTLIGTHGNGYSDPANWSPPEVPNNTATRQYNVTAPEGFYLDTNATISNLTIGSGAVSSAGNSLTVTGATTIDVPGTSFYLSSFNAPPITFSLGALSSFSNGTLSGIYSLHGLVTLQFTGADVRTLSASTLTIDGAAQIVDENGADGLRNLAAITSDASLAISSRDFVTAGDLTMNGALSIADCTFIVTGALTNYDRTSRTLRDGSYVLSGSRSTTARLQFRGADIANNAASLSLAGSAAVVDESGRDALSNLSHNLAAGQLKLSQLDFTTTGDFTNDGFISLTGSSMSVAGALTNYDSVSKTLNGGAYVIMAYGSTPGRFSFPGADIVHNNASLSVGNVPAVTDDKGNDALRNLADNLANGSLQFLVPFTFPSDFTNAGTVTFLQNASVPAGHVYAQSAGSTAITGANFTGTMHIEGGQLAAATVPGSAHSLSPPRPAAITGNLTIGNATLKPTFLSVTGDLTLSAGSTLHHVITSANAANLSVSGKLTLAGSLEVEYTSPFPVASMSSFIVARSGSITGAFSNVANGGRIMTTDGAGSFVLHITQSEVILTDYQRAVPPSQLMNISTRAEVLTGNDVAIGGFIIYGSDPIQVVVRAIGPSMASAGVTGTLQDPVLELHDAKGALLTTNDNWQDTQAADIRATGLAPSDAREAALVTTLQPGAYTAVVRGKSDTTGVALVEVYDLSKDAHSKLANISTRGFVDPDHPLIGGIISGGNGQGNAELVVRALGEDLQAQGLSEPNILVDPAFEIHDADGVVVGANDDVSSPPENSATFPRELNPNYIYDAATGVVLRAGKYTVVVHGNDGTRGDALVEIYDLNR